MSAGNCLSSVRRCVLLTTPSLKRWKRCEPFPMFWSLQRCQSSTIRCPNADVGLVLMYLMDFGGYRNHVEDWACAEIAPKTWVDCWFLDFCIWKTWMKLWVGSCDPICGLLVAMGSSRYVECLWPTSTLLQRRLRQYMEPLQQIYMEPKKIVVEDDLVVYHRCSGGATLTGPP